MCSPRRNYLPTGEPLTGWCPQYKLMDYSGVDSLISPCVSLVAILVFNVIRFDKFCGFDKWSIFLP